MSVQYAIATPLPVPVRPSASDDPVALRDELTRTFLAAVPEAPRRTEIRAFLPRWWDGAAWSPCLVLRVGRTRARLVEIGGQVVAVPGSARRARRVIARMRRPPGADAGLLAPAPRPVPAVELVATHATAPAYPGRVIDLEARRVTNAGPLVQIAQGGDAVSCHYADCGGLTLLPAPGLDVDIAVDIAAPCPRCGKR